MEAVLDSDARSFVPVPEASHFPLYNLPYGIFSPSAGESPRVGVRIGDHVLDLSIIADMGLLEAAGLPHGIFSQPWLNAQIARGNNGSSSTAVKPTTPVRSTRRFILCRRATDALLGKCNGFVSLRLHLARRRAKCI